LLKDMPGGVIALGFVSLFMDVSSEMIHSVLPLFMTTTLGVSALYVGVIEGIAEATASVVKVFSGAFSDWIGKRKPLLLAGYGLSTLTKPLFPLAHDFATVLFARFADRVGKGIRGAPRDALVADITEPAQRGAAYGLRQTMDTVGAFTGPSLAILLMLATRNDFRFVFTAALFPALIVMLIIAFGIHEPKRHDGARKPFPLKSSQIKLLPAAFWWLTGFSAVLTLARFSEAFLVLRGDSLHMNAAYAPMLLIIMNAVYAGSSWPVGVLSDKIGKDKLLSLGIATLVAADVVLAAVNNLPGLFFGCALWGLHMGLTQGLISALIADHAPSHIRGTGFGLYNLVTGGALLLASLIAGALWEHGPAVTFAAGACFSLLSLGGFVLLQPKFAKEAA
jgi:MFS family permease